MNLVHNFTGKPLDVELYARQYVRQARLPRWRHDHALHYQFHDHEYDPERQCVYVVCGALAGVERQTDRYTRVFVPFAGTPETIVTFTIVNIGVRHNEH